MTSEPSVPDHCLHLSHVLSCSFSRSCFVYKVFCSPGSVDKENIGNVVDVARRMLPHQLLVFASTSAITEGHGDQCVDEDASVKIELMDIYSSSMYRREQALQQLSSSASDAPQIVGLRFGTVVGTSSNQRLEMLHNALVNSAFTQCSLTVTHPEAHRGFLGMDDLVEAIRTLIAQRKRAQRFDIFHLQSFHSNVGGEIYSPLLSLLSLSFSISFFLSLLLL